jgi:Ca2+-transporting ATPase
VCIELFKALSAVSVDSSLFTIGPNKNPMLVIGVAVPFFIHIFLLYSSKLGFSGLAKSFGLVRHYCFVCMECSYCILMFVSNLLYLQAPLSLSDWKTVLKWSAPILVVEEALKAIGRRRKS